MFYSPLMCHKTHSDNPEWGYTDTQSPLICSAFMLQWVEILKLALSIVNFFDLLNCSSWGVPCFKRSSSTLILDDVKQHGDRGKKHVTKLCHSLALICLQPAATFHSVWKGVWLSDELTVWHWLICWASPNQWLLWVTELVTYC